MASTFAALETRLNAAVFKRLSNADAILNSLSIQGIVDTGFDHQTLDGYGTAGSSPTFNFDASGPEWSAWLAQPALFAGKTLAITTGKAAGNYKILHADPDTSGAVVLHLIT